MHRDLQEGLAAVGGGLEQVVSGSQLQQVAVLVQQGEDVLLRAVLCPLDGQLVGGGAVDLDDLPRGQGGARDIIGSTKKTYDN